MAVKHTFAYKNSAANELKGRNGVLPHFDMVVSSAILHRAQTIKPLTYLYSCMGGFSRAETWSYIGIICTLGPFLHLSSWGAFVSNKCLDQSYTSMDTSDMYIMVNMG